ncbi:hypothetical protein K0U07_00980 [bacterium]|nr:hypothetical protein [bacterium]
MDAMQIQKIHQANYKNLAMASPDKHVIVVNTSKKGLPQFQEFTKVRAALTTKRFGANAHLLFGADAASHLQTLRSRLVYEIDQRRRRTRQDVETKSAAIAKIDLILGKHGKAPTTTNKVADTDPELILKAAAHGLPSIYDHERPPTPPPRTRRVTVK